MIDGDTLGSLVVGEDDCDRVGSEVVGEIDGDIVGSEDVGDTDREELWPLGGEGGGRCGS